MDETQCRNLQMKLNLKWGGADNYETKGCYAYVRSDTANGGTVFFGRGGTTPDRLKELSGSKYRLWWYDKQDALQECARLGIKCRAVTCGKYHQWKRYDKNCYLSMGFPKMDD